MGRSGLVFDAASLGRGFVLEDRRDQRKTEAGNEVEDLFEPLESLIKALTSTSKSMS